MTTQLYMPNGQTLDEYIETQVNLKVKETCYKHFKKNEVNHNGYCHEHNNLYRYTCRYCK